MHVKTRSLALCLYFDLHTLSSYLEKVLQYLSDFLDRVHPLLDQNALYEEIEKEFEDKWLQGNFPGWRVSAWGII